MKTPALVLRRRTLGALLASVASWLARPPAALAATGPDASNPSVGNASLVAGSVLLSRAGQDAQALWQGALLFQGDRLDTRADGELHISFEDGGYLALRPNSALTIDSYIVTGAASDSAALRLLRGALRSVTGWIGKLEPKRYSLAATTVFVGVRGTDHEVIVVPPEEATAEMAAGVHNRVNEGGTTLRNDQGSIDIDPGHAAYSPGTGMAPRAHACVPAFFDRRHTTHEAAAVEHARNGRRVEADGPGQRALVDVGRSSDGLQRSKLHRRDPVRLGFLQEDRHGDLLQPADVVPWQQGQVERIDRFGGDHAGFAGYP